MIFELLLLALGLGIFLVVKKVQNENQKLPPGPWGLPLLGHLVSLGLNPHLNLMKWKKKYGPIIRCRFGSFPTVVLCDSKLIKEAFSMPEFSGRPPIQVFLENDATHGIGFSEGPYNTELRQFAMRKFKEFGMGRKLLEDQIHDGISEFMNFIQMREGQPIYSNQFPSSHILRSLWSIMMTEELNSKDVEQLSQKINILGQLGPVLGELAGFMPWLENIARTISFGQLSLISLRSNQMEQYYSFFAKLLEKKKQNWEIGEGQTQTPIDIMDFYLEKVKETKDESSPFHPSHKSEVYFLGDIFSAGTHTTNTSIIWVLSYIANNPEVQSKLQEEIDQVIGNSRLPSTSDRGQMPYTDAMINELLRMSSVLPLALPHCTTTDVCFHGYTIKKGTMVFANLYGVHHDPEIWGDPENFRPERWLGDSGKKLKNDHFLPFSIGRRICPGEALAREQLFLYLTSLFQRYTVDFDLFGKENEVNGVFGAFLTPSKFTVLFNQRKSNKII